jgi:hypothetical protein
MRARQFGDDITVTISKEQNAEATAYLSSCKHVQNAKTRGLSFAGTISLCDFNFLNRSSFLRPISISIAHNDATLTV